MSEKIRKLSDFALLAAIFILPFSKAGLEAFLATSIISWFLYQLIRRKSLCENKAFLVTFILLCVTSSISMFEGGYLSKSLRGILKLLKYGSFALVTAEFLGRNSASCSNLFKTVIVSLLLVFADVIYQMVTGMDLIYSWPIQSTDIYNRVSGPFQSYGLLAAFLIGFLPVLTGLFISVAKKHSGKKAAGFLFIVAGLVFLFFTYSRGAWIAFMVAVFLFLALMGSKKYIFILMAAVAIAIPFLPKKFLIHPDAQGKEQSIVERFHLWMRATQVIQAKPLFGCGINTYYLNYAKFDKLRSWRVPGYYAHNGYLQLAAETGLISLALFLVLIGIAFKNGYHAFHSAQDPGVKWIVSGFLSGALALLVQAGVDTTLHNLQSAVLIWFFIGALLGLGTLGKKSQHGIMQK